MARTAAERSADVDARGRRKLDEADARALLLSTAQKLVKAHGADRLTIAEVLEGAQLGTRAFYRNFSSKEELLQTVFLEMARVETMRLRRRMSGTADPVHGVALWIAGRLDLAFNEKVRSELRSVSRDAQSQSLTSSHLVDRAYTEMLAPLVEQLEMGRGAGLFPGLDAEQAARLIHGALWACTQFAWTTGDKAGDTDAVRYTVAFCLNAIEAPRTMIDTAIEAVTQTFGRGGDGAKARRP